VPQLDAHSGQRVRVGGVERFEHPMYADHQPMPDEAAAVERAFGSARGPIGGSNLSETQSN
jgi:hypothetical protein